jgi:hypothetical protein
VCITESLDSRGEIFNIRFSFSTVLSYLTLAVLLRWAGHVEFMGGIRGTYRVLEGKPEGRRPLERLRLRWEDNIKNKS